MPPASKRRSARDWPSSDIPVALGAPASQRRVDSPASSIWPSVNTAHSAADERTPRGIGALQPRLTAPFRTRIIPAARRFACFSPKQALRFPRFPIRPGVQDRKVRIKREAGALDEQGRRCPRNGNRPRSHGSPPAQSPLCPAWEGERGARRKPGDRPGGFDWCCGGQHRQARPPAIMPLACSCPPQKL